MHTSTSRSSRVAVFVAVVASGLGAAVACGKSAGTSGAAPSDGGGSASSSSSGGNPSPDGGGTPLGTGEDSGADAQTTVDSGPPPLPAACNGSVLSIVDAGASPPAVPTALTVPTGFTIESVAAVGSARELAALPNGDLLVATSGTDVYLVPNAEGTPGTPVVFTSINDTPVQGITYSPYTCTIYVGSHAGIYSASYQDAQQSGTFKQIAAVRTGEIAPNSDGDVHVTTSVGYAGGMLYAGVGSSCNACTEVDPTRAVVLQVSPDGGLTTKATRFRNAIALATNPATGTLWAGGAGQDDLPEYHPYEFFDSVTLHPGVADYGWPECEEDHVAYTADASCAGTVAPAVELPAYSTIIGATFYPATMSGPYTFPAPYPGSLFLAAHGSWHQEGSAYVSPPVVAFVPMTGDTPNVPVTWTDATAQWSTFVGGWQTTDGTARNGRATGITVGPQGSLFIADDQNGLVYRVRPK